MTDNGGDKVRVTLRWIQILDSKDLDSEGEFRFRSKVTTAGRSQELEFPDDYWRISEHFRHNKVDKIDRVLYEGDAGASLVVELFGEEIDKLSANDPLEVYRRTFSGEPSGWVGTHQPSDEGSDDPENLSDWRVCYDIEIV